MDGERMETFSDDESTCRLNEDGNVECSERNDKGKHCHLFKRSHSTFDEPDRLPKNPTFKWYEAASLIFSTIMYIGDTGSDIVVVYMLYDSDKMLYFYLTLTFIIVPTITMTIFSLRWYIVDSKLPGAPPTSPAIWVVRVIFLLLQLGPALRYIDSLKYGLKFRKCKNRNEEDYIKYYDWMSYEDADAALLRLFESFLEAAPQLLLQINILARPDSPSDPNIVLVQQLSCAISLGSLAWALAAQQRAMRVSLKNSENISWAGTIVQCLWFLFTIGSRMLTLGLFVSILPLYLVGICAFRVIVMTVWILTMHTDFCKTKVEEFFYNCLLGVMFLFTYFNPKEGSTRWRYFFYYVYTFTENSILIGIWYNWVEPDLWYKLPAILTVFLSFFVGILFMAIYYLLLHPSKGKVRTEPATPDSPLDQPPFKNNGECSPMRELKVVLPKNLDAAQGQSHVHFSSDNQTNTVDQLNVNAVVHSNGAYGTPV